MKSLVKSLWKSLWKSVVPAAVLPLLVAPVAGCGSSISQQLAGRWVSAACEPAGPGLYVKRDFTLTESTWKLVVTLYTDAPCSARFAGIDVDGPYEVKGPSQPVAGATEVDYKVSGHHVTAYSDAALQALNQSGCGPSPRALNQALDITQTGCPAFMIPSVAACPFEMDLNKIDGDNLYFGDRSSDLCKARPTKLGQLPVTRMR